MENHKTTQFISSLIVAVLLLAACGEKKCEKVTEIPMNSKLKASLQGVYNYNYWLLVNDLGDTIEISCDDSVEFTYGADSNFGYPRCETIEYFIRDTCKILLYLSGRASEYTLSNYKDRRKPSFFVQSNLESNKITIAYPYGWKFNWLSSEQKMDNSVRVDEKTYVKIDKFTDYNKKEYQNVYYSHGSTGLGHTYFIISPDIGIIGFFGTDETREYTGFKPQDTLRLVEVR